MRSATQGRRKRFRISLPVAGATAAIAAAIALIVSVSIPGGSTTAPTGQTASVRTAAVLLATEQAATSDLSTSALQPPDDFCSNLVSQYGGSMTTSTVSSTSVTLPDFRVPSTFGVNTKATALKLQQQNWRMWSDAVSSALPKNAQGKFTMQAVEASTCMAPDYASMMVRGLASVEIGGVTVAHLNKWMTSGSPSPMNTQRWANHCMDGGISVRIQCAKVMQNVAYLLTKFKPLGVRHDNPSWYFRVRNGLVVGSVPPIESVMGSYSGEFLEFEYTTKAQGCFIRLGVNVGRGNKLTGGDERLAGFLCDQPQIPSQVVPPTTQPASPPVSHSPKPHPSPSTSTPSTPPTAPPTHCGCSTPPTAPSTSPPTHCGCTTPPTSTPTSDNPTTPPPATQPPTSAPPTQCGCTASPTASPTVTQTQCGCTASPSGTPSASVTPSDITSSTDTATPTDTPTAQCTCMASNPDSVAQVQAEALSLGFSNIYYYGAYPPPGTKNGAAMVP